MSLPAVPDDVFFSYGSIDDPQIFNSTVRTKVKETPITSGDNRTVKYSQLTISVTGYVTIDEAGTNYQSAGAVIATGGTGYTVGDVLTLVGGTHTQTVTLRVDTIDGAGAAMSLTVLTVGAYTVVPTNPVTVEGGTGANFTVTMTWSRVSYNTIDAYMLAMRRRLQVNGKNLKYINKGYGIDLNINGRLGESIRDCNFGPKPGELTWTPMGGAPHGCHAAIFEWEVTTWIAECGSFNPMPGVFSEISFTVTYETDEAGLVTIVYNGNAQIPLSLQSGQRRGDPPRILYNIDQFIMNIFRPCPVGFLRRMSRQLSTDRASCSFTITDRQIEVPYPEDVVAIDMRHRIKQRGPFQPVWECSITGTIRLSPTAPKALAFQRFFSIAAQRIAWIRNHPPVPRDVGPGTEHPKVPIFGPIEMEEDLFKNESRFTIPFRMMGAPFNHVAQVSGLWRPVVNTPHLNNAPNYQWTAAKWNATLADNAQRNGGLMQARFDNNDEVIIDVCNNRLRSEAVARDPNIAVSADQISDEAQNVDDKSFEGVEPGDLLTGVGGTTMEELFPPETSWLHWECTVNRIVDHRRVRHRPLGGTVTYTDPKVDPFAEVSGLQSDASDPAPDWTTTETDIIQQTASPSLTVVVRGFGARVVHRVNPPKLLNYGGRDVHLLDEQISETTLGVGAGVTAYRTSWTLVYLVTGGSSEIPLMANPFLGTDGQGAA